MLARLSFTDFDGEKFMNNIKDDQFIDLYNKAYAIVKDKPYDINPADWCKAEFDLKKEQLLFKKQNINLSKSHHNLST